jgi:predicted XRE-type DNA-binding protein
MTVRKWDEVRAELFAGREEEIRAAKEQLREEIRAYRLAEIRKARHLTQQQVAAEMGVTTARVSQIEHGQVDRAAIRGLAVYVEALGGHLELVANFGDERIVIGLRILRLHLSECSEFKVISGILCGCNGTGGTSGRCWATASREG